MNYLDVPHEIERLFVDVMKYAIAEIDSKIEVLAIDHEKSQLFMQILKIIRNTCNIF